MPYERRYADVLLDELVQEVPAVLLLGPRAVGKTTTAERRAKSIVHLDRKIEAGAFQADPDAALRDLPEPVLLDEWQAVPEVLGAVKRSVDRDPHPGRFLVTGSVRAQLQSATWPGTGRLLAMTLRGMTVQEQLGWNGSPLFLDRLASGQDLAVPTDLPDVRGYVDLALKSGFPEAQIIARPNSRRRWINSYITQLVTRDASELGESRDPSRLRRFLQAAALNSGCIVTEQTLLQAAALNRRTADAYIRLLKDLFVLDVLPPWLSNRLSRLNHMNKLFIADAGLMAALSGVEAGAVLADGGLLGRFIASFVVSQLRAQAEFCQDSPELFHTRDRDSRHEVDVVVEFGAGRVAGIEVKAGAAVDSTDARHLRWMRDHVGKQFIGGVVLHTGPRLFRLDDSIVAAPIGALWG